jgi:lipoic acid synthetase
MVHLYFLGNANFGTKRETVARFVTPAQFELFREEGLKRGFRECVSGPMVRSSYRAEQALAGNNVGLLRAP